MDDPQPKPKKKLKKKKKVKKKIKKTEKPESDTDSETGNVNNNAANKHCHESDGLAGRGSAAIAEAVPKEEPLKLPRLWSGSGDAADLNPAATAASKVDGVKLTPDGSRKTPEKHVPFSALNGGL